jgi:hypothetical protein
MALPAREGTRSLVRRCGVTVSSLDTVRVEIPLLLQESLLLTS